MESFEFVRRTQVCYGRNTGSQVGELIRRAGGSRVLALCSHSATESGGLFEIIMRSLRSSGLEVVEMEAEVSNNPRASVVRRGVRICRQEHVNFVLAVGDACCVYLAKGIAAGMCIGEDVMQLFSHPERIVRSLPLGVILTQPCGGAERSPLTYLVDEENGIRSVKTARSDTLVPALAVINPLMVGHPDPRLIAESALDIMGRALTLYFSPTTGAEVTDGLCETLMRSALALHGRLGADLGDLEAMGGLMWTSSLFASGALMGRAVNWSLWRLGCAYVSLYDCAPKEALALILPAWLEYQAGVAVSRMSELGCRVLGLPFDFAQPGASARRAVEWLGDWVRGLPLPHCLEEVGGNALDVPDLLERVAAVPLLSGAQDFSTDYEAILSLSVLRSAQSMRGRRP
ncbi:MAG: iron-containing alcohol dehydrogenase [Succinivibrionaceae bacterium]|nr:iron-containing alcohol dehydrogenase [Succinivibrionaceae bacterium]